MTVSLLRCELNTEEVPERGIIAQSVNSQYLWRIWVDSKLIAERALPISPTDNWIELENSIEYPIRGDGYRWVFVRRIGNYVTWFNPAPDDPLGGYSPGLSEGEIVGFQYHQYLTAISECLKKDNAVKYRDVDPNGSNLLELQPAELSDLIARTFPGADTPLYTTPSLPNDPRGVRLIRAVKRNFLKQLPDHIDVSDEPDQITELCIALDIEGFPEGRWLIGQSDTGITVKFVSYPHFPLWLSGKHVDKVFEPIYQEIMSNSH